MTSAPMSPRSMLQNGPARMRVRSTTRRPDRGKGGSSCRMVTAGRRLANAAPRLLSYAGETAEPHRPMPSARQSDDSQSSPRLLEGKTGLVMGVASKRSIAWGIATSANREGARLALGYQSERLADNL